MSKRRLETIEGRAGCETVHRGTASEHDGVVLTTSQGEKLVLERIGGNPFEDTDTRGLIGREVAVEGFRLGAVFRYVNVTEKP
jgi:hypothetical protein